MGSRRVVPAALLLAFLLTQYADAMWIPFVNEDYSFLDLAARRTPISLLGDSGLHAGPWFRPWSQGIHYWLLQRFLGADVFGWHVASALLVLGIWVAFFALVHRVAGLAVASLATACVAALAGWGTLIAWIAGVQDLWMLLFSLLALLALASDRRYWAALALGLALASKETALVVPALGLGWVLLIERRGVREALARTWPLGAVALAWILVHPTIGPARWLRSPVEGATHGGPFWDAAPHLLPALVNLDQPVRPELGWGGALARAAFGAIPLLLLVLWGMRREKRGEPAEPRPPERSVATFGAGWCLLGWLPLFLPSLGWHGYYALLGMLGAWLALAVGLRRFPRILLVSLVATLCVLRAGRAITPSQDWGEESYVRRAGEFLVHLRRDLQAKVPRPPAHTRMYFDAVPSGVGFLVGDGPALRIWYGDSTLGGGFYRDFRARRSGEPAGTDRFFRYDRTAGWIEVVLGPEDAAAGQRANPRWATDHELVALAIALGGDPGRAEIEYAKLAAAFPRNADYPRLAALMAAERGDSAAARAWRATELAIGRPR